MAIDLKMTNDGELILTQAGDLALCYGDEEITQEVLFRLKTSVGDWVLSPTVGCNLEEFIGQPNTANTCNLIAQRIENSITSDGLLSFPRVDVVSTGPNDVFILIEFSSSQQDSRTIQIQSSLDLRKGLVWARVT